MPPQLSLDSAELKTCYVPGHGRQSVKPDDQIASSEVEPFLGHFRRDQHIVLSGAELGDDRLLLFNVNVKYQQQLKDLTQSTRR